MAAPVTAAVPSVVVSDLFMAGQPLPRSVELLGGESNNRVRVSLTAFADGDDIGVACSFVHVTEGLRHDGSYTLSLTWDHRTPFGGRRLWFLCPGCSARARRLFLRFADAWLVCRTCGRIQYLSQRGRRTRGARRMARAMDIRKELGGASMPEAPFPPRPKGMHRKTYERLREEALKIEEDERFERVNEAVTRGDMSLTQALAMYLEQDLSQRRRPEPDR